METGAKAQTACIQNGRGEVADPLSNCHTFAYGILSHIRLWNIVTHSLMEYWPHSLMEYCHRFSYGILSHILLWNIVTRFLMEHCPHSFMEYCPHSLMEYCHTFAYGILFTFSNGILSHIR